MKGGRGIGKEGWGISKEELGSEVNIRGEKANTGLMQLGIRNWGRKKKSIIFTAA